MGLCQIRHMYFPVLYRVNMSESRSVPDSVKLWSGAIKKRTIHEYNLGFRRPTILRCTTLWMPRRPDDLSRLCQTRRCGFFSWADSDSRRWAPSGQVSFWDHHWPSGHIFMQLQVKVSSSCWQFHVKTALPWMGLLAQSTVSTLPSCQYAFGLWAATPPVFEPFTCRFGQLPCSSSKCDQLFAIFQLQITYQAFTCHV